MNPQQLLSNRLISITLKAMSIDHDQLFKQLLSTFFLDFLELFFPEVLTYVEPDSLVFLEQEFFTDIPLGEKKLLDVVVKVRFKAVPLPPSLQEEAFFIIHVENQATAQSQFPRRMFRYFMRLFERHDLPVYPIVLFSFDTPQRPEPNSFQIMFPDLPLLDFRFQAIQLNRLSWRDFVNRQNPVASALMSKMQIAPQDRPRVKLECLRLLATLQLDPARMQLISGFVDTYLQLNREEERQFTAQLSTIKASEQEQVMQIVTSWMEQGLERGEQVGRQREALSFVLRLLTRRLGSLSSETQQQIEQLSLTELEALGEDLLDFAVMADLHLWLSQNP